MFAYFSLLIELGHFDTIDCNFLMVGHTHGSIDQQFSVYSRKIKGKKFIGSRLALHDLLLHAYDDSPQRGKNPSICKQIQVVYDVKKMLDPYINHNIKYFQYPHVFRFTSYCGKAIMQYKMFSNHDEWLPKKRQDFNFSQPIEYIALKEIAKKNNQLMLQYCDMEQDLLAAVQSTSKLAKVGVLSRVFVHYFYVNKTFISQVYVRSCLKLNKWKWRPSLKL